MKRIICILFYFIAFLLISGSIYRLIIMVPPLKESMEYKSFCILSGLGSLLITACLVAACILLDKGKKE